MPHKQFTFSSIWLFNAQFAIRHGDLTAARKSLGQAIGLCPRNKLFKGYIDLEKRLFEFVRCRTLYEKQIEFNPSNSSAWIEFAELERGLDDVERARGKPHCSPFYTIFSICAALIYYFLSYATLILFGC